MNKPIFVFGSNTAGRHGAGAARTAVLDHGAVYGQGVGLQGNSYGLPTKNRSIQTLSLASIELYVRDFIEFASDNPELTFNVTRIGCGLAGYTDRQIAPMFVHAPSNVNLPSEWEVFMPSTKQYSYIHWNFD